MGFPDFRDFNPCHSSPVVFWLGLMGIEGQINQKSHSCKGLFEAQHAGEICRALAMDMTKVVPHPTTLCCMPPQLPCILSDHPLASYPTHKAPHTAQVILCDEVPSLGRSSGCSSLPPPAANHSTAVQGDYPSLFLA